MKDEWAFTDNESLQIANCAITLFVFPDGSARVSVTKARYHGPSYHEFATLAEALDYITTLSRSEVK